MTFIKVKENKRSNKYGYDSLRGYGSITDQFVDFVSSSGSSIINAGSDAARSAGSDAAERILRSSQFSEILDSVEGKAREGVKKEVSENALSLLGVAVASGALGGYLVKNTAGVAVASVIGILAGMKIINNSKNKQ